MKLAEFDYELPEALIAQRPIEPRTDARLLVYDGEIAHKHIYDLPELLHPGDLLVFNDTRVIPARLPAKKPSGGAVEVLLCKPLGEKRFLAMMRNAKGASRLIVADDFEVIVERNNGGGFYDVLLQCDDVMAQLQKHGHIPLPPYIKRPDDERDRDTYQTAFADKPGSSAAPTAGLHFTDALLDQLKVERAGLTLHVGPGTFLPVREEAEEDIRLHTMHAEIFDLPAATVEAIHKTKVRGGRVIAVGTTSCRTLESAALFTVGDQSWGRVTGKAEGPRQGALVPMRGESELFITPGFPFAVVDVLMTNFHLPRSTLLMLVAAFVGFDEAKRIYREAVKEKYRFFSYGDGSLLGRNPRSRT